MRVLSVYESSDDVLARSFPAHSEAIYGPKKITADKQIKANISVKSTLPIVRDPNRTLEKPMGLVLLTWRSETKRSTLPNEVTSLDTVKALFVRSFSDTLSMSPSCWLTRKIYILDDATNVYYELENVQDVKDRSVLKVVESTSSCQTVCSSTSPTSSRSGSATPTSGIETQNRMASMEAQLANLTAWVQTAVTKDRSPGSSIASDESPQPMQQNNGLRTMKNILHAVKTLQNEQKQLRRIHLTNANDLREGIFESFKKFKEFVESYQKSIRNVPSNPSSFVDEILNLERFVERLKREVDEHDCSSDDCDITTIGYSLASVSKRLCHIRQTFSVQNIQEETTPDSSTKSCKGHVTFNPAVTEISQEGSVVEWRVLRKVPPPPPPRRTSKLMSEEENESLYSTVKKRTPPAVPEKNEELLNQIYHQNYHKVKKANANLNVDKQIVNNDKNYSETEIF
ncbi:DgyrCDS6748 [Dimorphilus gyrociliatus]|uniref:DgyrCDS6748 n=1 Tax=Dimorphilus gyrociliatus TaxID=2664684 RepID=A0A7I8VPK5_9ANNE|nr:DgyrCDS6748 [Dimorphilus gyrociliatus]